jgi:hypothetical protein
MQFAAWPYSPCLFIDDNSSSLQDSFRARDIDLCEMTVRSSPHTEKIKNAQLLGKKNSPAHNLCAMPPEKPSAIRYSDRRGC